MERAVVRSSARLSGGGGPSKSGGDKASSRAEAARRAAAAAAAAERRARARQRAEEVEDGPSVLRDKCRELARVVRQAKHLVVYTGAGISTAADIPDYRGPHGVWTRLQRGEDIGRVEVSRAAPTFTHMALAALVARGLVKFVVSQNCDGLHVRSGLPRRALAELHGDMFAERCAAPACRAVLLRAFDTTQRTRRYSHGTRRTCPVARCGRPLRDTIVHFGERARAAWPLNWAGALRHAAAADVILCLGSSLKVLRRYPRLWCMARPARARPRLYIVNLQWTPKDTAAELKINARCDVVMRELARRLRVRVPRYRPSRDPLLAHATPLAPAEQHTCSRPVLPLPLPLADSSSSEPSELDSSSASDSDDALPLTTLQERLRAAGDGPSRANGPRGPAGTNGPVEPVANRTDGPSCQKSPPNRRNLEFPERPRGPPQMEGLRRPLRPVPGLRTLRRPERSSDHRLQTEKPGDPHTTNHVENQPCPTEREENQQLLRTPNAAENCLRPPRAPKECSPGRNTYLQNRQVPFDRSQDRQLPPSCSLGQQPLPNSWRDRLSPLNSSRDQQSPHNSLRDQHSPPNCLKNGQIPPNYLLDRQYPPNSSRDRQSPPKLLRDRQFPPNSLQDGWSPQNLLQNRQYPPNSLQSQHSPPNCSRDRQSPPDFLRNRHPPSYLQGPPGTPDQRVPQFPMDRFRGPQPLTQHSRAPEAPARPRGPETPEERLRDPAAAEPEEKKPKLENGFCAVVKEEHLTSFEVSLSDGPARILLRAAHAPEPKEEEDEGGGVRGVRGVRRLEPAAPAAEVERAAAAIIARAVLVCRAQLYPGLHTILGAQPAPAGACAWCARQYGSRRCLWYPARAPLAPGRVWRRVRGRRYLCTCCPRDVADSEDEGGEGGWYGKGYRKGRKKRR